MRAPEIWQAVVDAMEDDDVIAPIAGGAIYLTDGERAFEVPSITGTLIASTQGERFTMAEFQLDFFGKSMTQVIAMSDRALSLFDHDVRRVISGMRMWTRCTDEREFYGPVADQTYRRSLDFEFEVPRRRYVWGSES